VASGTLERDGRGFDRPEQTVQPVDMEGAMHRTALAHRHHAWELIGWDRSSIVGQGRHDRRTPLERQLIDLVEPASEDDLGRLVEEEGAPPRVNQEDRDSQTARELTGQDEFHVMLCHTWLFSDGRQETGRDGGLARLEAIPDAPP
jgi:hypothetical protein